MNATSNRQSHEQETGNWRTSCLEGAHNRIEIPWTTLQRNEVGICGRLETHLKQSKLELLLRNTLPAPPPRHPRYKDSTLKHFTHQRNRLKTYNAMYMAAMPGDNVHFLKDKSVDLPQLHVRPPLYGLWPSSVANDLHVVAYRPPN